MVCRVCMSDDVKRNKLSRQLYPSSRMETKPLARWSIGHWRSLDYLFVLILLLQCHSGTSEAAATTEAVATTTNVTVISAATTITNSTLISAAATTTNATLISAATTTNATLISAATTTNATLISTATTTNATLISAAATTTNATPISATTTNATIISAAITNATLISAATTNVTTTNATAATAEASTNSLITATIFTSTSMKTTHELSSSSNTAVTMPMSTPALTTTPMPCNFSLNCNRTFYWMQISVNGESQNESNVREWLNNLNNCTQSGNNKRDNQSSLVEDSEVTCEKTNATMLCDVLLMLREPANVCCISETSWRLAGNSSNVTIMGDIERVGVCLINRTSIQSGPNYKCNQSVSSNDLCSSATQNFTCGNNETMKLLLLDYQKNCSTNQSTSSENSCNCSSNCNASSKTSLLYAYYSFNVGNKNMNASAVKSYFEQVLNTSCSNKLPACNSLQTLERIYLDYRVTQRSEEINTIILRLNGTVDACVVQEVLEAIIEAIRKDNITVDSSPVTRVAMCSKDNPFKGDITVVQLSVSLSVFCMLSDAEILHFGKCSEGSSVAFLLNDTCNSQTFPKSTTTPPSSTASTNTSLIDADGLLKMTANASALNSTEVDSIITQLEKLIAGPNVSVALANTSVSIVNNLLDVPVAVMTPFSRRASGIVDTVGLKLVVSGETESLLSSSLALAVKKVNGNNFEETSFSITDPSNLQIRSDSRLKRDVVGQVRSIPLGSITLPASLTQNLSVQEQNVASRVQFNFYQKNTFFQDKALGKKELISGILSASVGNLSISGLQKNVTITLQITQPIPETHSASCVFWDFTSNDGAGGWNTSGCHLLKNSSQETWCSCNHLTSFGVLLIISQNITIPPYEYTILTFITYIGCGISAIFLSITLLTYLAFEKLRKDIPSKILIQLCLALLLLNMVFLLDGWLAQYPEANGLCISTAFFLHYFLLASFTWMAMEAVHMYMALVKVFNTYVSRFMIKIGLAGWGIPLVVVIIVIATNHIGNNYGLRSYGKFLDGTPDQFCWITNDYVFYGSVVAYFGLVFLLNFTMFFVVLIQLCRIKRQNPHNVQNRSSWQDLRSVAGLTVLLGLAWGFAFFAWDPVTLPFMVLFAIFNTLQGLFIFVFHCAMKENVRRQWRTYLCCGKLRLPENSEWSRTATQKIKKASKKRPSSTQSNNSSSSFLNTDSLADVPMGISNPFGDSIITASEGPSSDVVMNELNDKHRNKKSY